MDFEKILVYNRVSLGGIFYESGNIKTINPFYS